MHVIELKTENYKRVVAVDVAPKGNVVEVVGKNAQGKSSLLESMLVALAGADYIPSKPIRKGENRASIRVKLGEDKPTMIVTRTFAAKEDGGYTTHLTIESVDGARYVKPQTLLDDLLGALSFDPLAFTRMKPAEQLEQLRAFVKGVDFEAIDGQNLRDFENRTDVNRELKSLKARLAAMPVPGDPRHERVDETALVAELEKAGAIATEIEKERARRLDLMREVRNEAKRAEGLDSEAQDIRDGIELLEQRIAKQKEELAGIVEYAHLAHVNAKRLQTEAEALPPLALPPDTADIKARIEAARRTNGEVSARERVMKDRDELGQWIARYEQQAKELTESIDGRDAAKASAVAAAKLPIEGLGIGDDTVLFNGLPFNQASSAEQLRVSVAIAAALSPKLRVAHVRDGSLLDDDGMQIMRELAQQYGFQVWIERVASDSPIGIVIEDGRVKANSEEAAA